MLVEQIYDSLVSTRLELSHLDGSHSIKCLRIIDISSQEDNRFTFLYNLTNNHSYTFEPFKDQFI